ncbi:MAG: 4-(cytidine 5'-diphospho)-2-C-methyl-D-erythritol kinase [Desulfovibrio sp.]|nr:4-(cytidine 5'-diphospho)-2-C-methyl-D-erythritol kinase [Desulfovibrio sp.]
MDMVFAGCKINLGLRITGKRADGFHEIDSIFWPLREPHDTLQLRFRPETGIVVHCSAPDIRPCNNTLTKAYAAMCSMTRNLPGVEVVLHKGIPCGAGLGGGSSDAAALLRWLNSHIAHPLDLPTLAKAALQAGADVPFFLQSSPCRVRGIGERLTAISACGMSGSHLVLVCPAVHASTPQAYADYDQAHAASADTRKTLTKAHVKANRFFPASTQFQPDLHNDLEAVVFSRHAQLAVIKADLLQHGGFAAMSGSGSALYALFAPTDAKAAQTAADALREKGWNVYTQTL